uniref:Uncharacterized protein n=1 Tax=viral metagenome TaxID=1070528 RepID=A0A6C0JGX1_9ZZZZ
MIDRSVSYRRINLTQPIKNLIDTSITITTKQKKRPKVANKPKMPKKPPTRDPTKEGGAGILTLSHLFM